MQSLDASQSLHQEIKKLEGEVEAFPTGRRICSRVGLGGGLWVELWE